MRHSEGYPERCLECQERGGGSQSCKRVAEDLDMVYKIGQVGADRWHPVLLGEDCWTLGKVEDPRAGVPELLVASDV